MSSRVRLAEISEQPLSVDRLLGLVSDRATGGIASSSAWSASRTPASRSPRSTTPSIPALRRQLRASAERVAEAYDVRAVAVEHRIGHLEMGDLAVVVATGAVHRGPALDACGR